MKETVGSHEHIDSAVMNRSRNTVIIIILLLLLLLLKIAYSTGRCCTFLKFLKRASHSHGPGISQGFPSCS